MADVPRPARARLGLSRALTAPSARAVLLAAGPLLFLAGLLATPILAHLLPRPLAQTLALWLLPLGLAAVAARALRQRAADLLAIGWGALLLVFAGPLPVLATVVLAAAALVLGHALLPRRPPELRIAVGLALVAGALGWLLALPVHRAIVYWPLLLALAGWRWRLLATEARALTGGWRVAVDAAPGAATVAIATLGLLSTAAWLPTLEFDDVVYHLALPAQLQQLGAYRFDAQSQMWALAPWGGDVLHGVVQVLAGGEGRGALNALWLLLLATLGFRLVRAVGEDAAGGFAGVALIASVPTLLWLVGGMQAELPSAVLAMAIALQLAVPPGERGGCGDGGEGERRRLFALAVLAGGLMTIKASNVLLALPLASWWLAVAARRLPWRWLPAGLGVLLLVGGSSYVFAWGLSGNPLLPLFNDVFPNAIAGGSGLDRRWLVGFGPDLPWRIAFETDRYVEAFPGGAGFLPVVLAGGAVAALAMRRTRALALAAIAAWVLAMLPMQYARYALPASLLLVPALVAGTRALAGGRAGMAMLGLVLVANLAFFANGSWIWRAGAVKRLLDPRDGGVVGIHRDFLPERMLGPLLQGRDDVRLLVVGPEPAIAEFGGRAFAGSRYDLELAAAITAAAEDGSAAAWSALFVEFGFTHLSLRPGLTPSLDAALPAIGGEPEAALGVIELWRLPVAPGARDLMRERDGRRALPLPAGNSDRG